MADDGNQGERRARLLVGTGDEATAEAARQALGLEYDLLWASSSDQALELSRGEPGPDLILLDVALEELDGLSLCRALKGEERTRGVPVLLLLSGGLPEHRGVTFEVGAADHVTKPPDLSTLKARVRTHLELRRLRELTGTALGLDPVTRVADQGGVEEFLALEWKRAAREATAISLILLRVDYFQGLTVSRGRPAADECLLQLSSELAASIRRPMDFLGRHDEDGFAVVLPVTEAYGAAYLAELMRQGVETLTIPNPGSTVSNFVTVSAGVSTTVPSPGSDPESLIQAAERGLELAILGGGNRVRRIEPSWPP